MSLRFLSRRRDDERGAVMVIATAGVVLAMISAALAVDTGRLAQDKRHDQKVADLAALDATRCLPANDAAPLCAQDYAAEAHASAVRNGFDFSAPGASLVATPGTLVAGIFVPIPEPITVPGLALATAVRVTATSLVKNVFMAGERTLTAKGTAAMGSGAGCIGSTCVVSDNTPIGTVRVGSTLASASSTDAVLLNRLLTNTVGGSYSTDLVGWQGIAAGNVSFDRLRTALGYSAGSVDTVLDTNFTMRQLLDATVNALNADGSPSSATAATKLATIASQASPTAGATFKLRNLFDIVGNVGNGTDVADATINVMDIVRGSMALADTDHFASFDLVQADLPLVPNLNRVTVKFGLIEAPRTKSGPPGKDALGVYRTTASTAQIRLIVEEHLNLSLAGLGLLDVTVPYYFDAGRADASLDAMECTGASLPDQVDILGTTRAGTVQIGAVTNSALANPLAAPTVGTTRLLSALFGTVWIDINAPVVQNIPGNGGALLGFNPTYNTTNSQAIPGVNTLSLPSLASGNLTVHVLGLGLNAGTITTQLLTGITNAVGPLTNSLVKPLLRSLGLTFAGADVWAPPPQKCEPQSFNTLPPPGTGTLVPTLVQ